MPSDSKVIIRPARGNLKRKDHTTPNLWVVECVNCGPVSKMIERRDALDKREYHLWNCPTLRQEGDISKSVRRRIKDTQPL